MIDRPKWSAVAPPALLALALIGVGALGVASTDFGHHWDEVNVIGSVENSIQSDLLLPRWYNYPSVSYDIGLLAALPAIAADIGRWFDPTSGTLGSPELATYLESEAFKLRLRGVFFLLSTLSGLAVYLLARRLSGSGWIGLFAALALVTSWEFVYHARWIAPDCLVLLFTSFSIWGQHHLMDPRETGRRGLWIALASIFAGLAAATKYPGAIVLVPLLVAVALAPRPPRPERFAVIRQAGACLLIAALTFALVSPGCLLEPARFVQNVLHEKVHYADSHGGYTVAPGWEHFSRLAIYLGLILLSGNMVPAAAGTALAIVGLAQLARSDARRAAWLASLPVLYVAYMTTQRVMIVRNYLLLLPFVAVCAALGLASLARAARGRPALGHLIRLAALALVAFNLVVATRSALSIVSPGPDDRRPALERRLASAPGTRFLLSPSCRKLLQAGGGRLPASVVATADSADRVIFASDEIRDWQLLAANVPGRYRTIWARMQEVNWDYYPTWDGSPRLLEVSAADRALIARHAR